MWSHTLSVTLRLKSSGTWVWNALQRSRRVKRSQQDVLTERLKISNRCLKGKELNLVHCTRFMCHIVVVFLKF